MADALCGPSNALQNFQKHTQVDRTLQQDRLISRQSPSQGFRSATPNAGILDPEFEAFQAGLPAGPPQFYNEPLRPFIPPQAPQQQIQPSPALSGWASDFQQLHISSPRPPSAHQATAPSIARQAHVARQSPASAASWHTDFLQNNSIPTYQPRQAMQPNYSWGHDMPMQMGYNSSAVSHGKQKEPVAEDLMDMAAFERAFDAAREEMLALEQETQRELQEDDAELDDVTRELQEETNHLAAQEKSQLKNMHYPDRMTADDWVEENRRVIEQLTDHPPAETLAEEQQKEEEEKPSPQDDDELSQVAGQLLDSVSHETSEKFQSSVFLQLMRRIRDKEVRVEGENFVETGTSSPAPLNSAIPSDEQDHDNGRYGLDGTVPAGSADALHLPSRPLTPEIDPPAPTLAQWRRRLLGVDTETPPP